VEEINLHKTGISKKPLIIGSYTKEGKMARRTVDHHEFLLKELQDPEVRRGYLNAALEDGEKIHFLAALKNVADAMGGVGKLAEESKLSRQHLYDMLSPTGNPTWENIRKVAHAFGLRVHFDFEPAGKKR
jgi:probable addiction module antidote protein